MKQHILDRHMDIDLHRVWIDEVARVATFPLWNLSGELTGYQSYRPDAGKEKKNDTKGRYYTFRGIKIIPRQCKTVAIWGLESWNLQNTLFITEGIFDAARLTRKGCSAIALLCNNPDTSLLNWLRIIRKNRPTVAICDPGSAGIKLAKTAHASHVVKLPENPDGDLGDANDEYVDALIREYS